MKGNIKKKLIIGSLALSLFSTGAFTGGAASGWVQQVIVDGQARIGKAASDKKNELISNIDAKVEEKMKDSMEGKISSREDEVERQLEEYFDQKVAEIGNSEDTVVIEEALDFKADDIVKIYKAEIDNAFGSVE